MIFEPIPAFGAMMMSLKMAKFPDADVAAAIQSLEARAKGTKASDAEQWISVYREALSVLDRVSVAQRSLEERQDGERRNQSRRQRLQACSSQVQNLLQKAAADWPSRLATQQQELVDKASRSIDKLGVVGIPDELRGETLFQVDPQVLGSFWDWVAASEAAWTSNNSKLAATRANELLEETRAELGPELAFEVGAAALSAPPFPDKRLRGCSLATPGTLDSLGTAYKSVMSLLMGGSSLAFVATRMSQDVGKALPFFFGAVFVGALAYTIVTVPRKKRQALHRLQLKAEHEVHRELLEKVKERLKVVSDAQAKELKKHLDAEAARWRTSVRTSIPEGPSMQLPTQVGLMPNDAAKAKGEWREAISKRVAELQA